MTPFFTLWAQIDSLDKFVEALRDRRGRGDSTEILGALLALAAVSVAVWALARLVERFCRKRLRPSPYRLLWSLSRAHRLRWSQWWLLRRIARQLNLEDPARLFLEPEWLDANKLGAEFAPRSREIQVLRARLFGDLAEMGGHSQPATQDESWNAI